MMRGVARDLLTMNPSMFRSLKRLPISLIAIIAVKMFLSVFHYELEPMYFFIILLLTFGATFIVHFLNKRKSEQGE